MKAPSLNVLALPDNHEFDRYRIERMLGAGGFGITYLATDTGTGKKVAIKEFLPTGIATRTADGHTVRPITEDNRELFGWGMARFRQEAQTLLKFQHPNVVGIDRYFEAYGTGYLVMQYIEGKSLGTVLRDLGTIENDEILEIILPLLDALSHVHAAGFLHRDIKPDNIFISADGRPILIDFGAARQSLGMQSHSLTAIVSEGYAPYEQYEARGNQGPWTDIYAVGALIYRCMTGERPVAAPSRVAAKFRSRPDPLPALSEVATGRYAASLIAMAERALAVSEDDRPQSVEKLLEVLRQPESAPTPKSPEPQTRLAEPTVVLAPSGGFGDAPAPIHDAAASERRAPRRGLSPGLRAAAILGALAVAGGAAAWVSGVLGPGPPSEGPNVSRSGAPVPRGSEELRKSPEPAPAPSDRDAERERRDRDEAQRRRQAEEERERQAEAERKRQADEEAQRRAQEEERRRAEEAKRQEEERVRGQRVKDILDRAADLMGQARAQLTRGRLPEARRTARQARERAEEAGRIDPESSDARRMTGEAEALVKEVEGRVAVRLRELVDGAERDIAAGRAAEAGRKLAEAERLDPDASEVAELRSSLKSLQARQEEAARRRREEEARRRGDAEQRNRRAAPPADVARPTEPRQTAPAPAPTPQPAPQPAPPSRTPERPMPIPP